MTEKQIFAEVENPEKRAQLIKDNCDEILKNSFMKKFSEDEIDEYKTELSENSIELDTLQTELSELKKEYKEKMKPKSTRVKFLLTCLRQKAIAVTDDVYVLKSETEYCIYNSEGKLLSSRPLKASEKQKTIYMR
jgi:predicted RNase H-like nuclease (RuvC/YqgF family)